MIGDAAGNSDHKDPARIQILDQLGRYLLRLGLALVQGGRDDDGAVLSVQATDPAEFVVPTPADRVPVREAVEHGGKLVVPDGDDRYIDFRFQLGGGNHFCGPERSEEVGPKGNWRVVVGAINAGPRQKELRVW